MRNDFKIIILEKTQKLLSKVRISGGGRCNVTNATFDNADLVKNYPRGQKELVQVFSQFTTVDTIAWFKKQGVILKTEDDGRIFPVTDSSETIINCFLSLCKELKIEIKLGANIKSIKQANHKLMVNSSEGNYSADAVVCAFGGHTKSSGYELISNLGHSIVSPIPSLFTFNLPNARITKQLQGLSVASAIVGIAGSKQKITGPLLVTHWGLSGPAVLKLSAFAAEELFSKNYEVDVIVNWCPTLNSDAIFQTLKQAQKNHHRMLFRNLQLFGLPKRLWEYLVEEASIADTMIIAEVPDKLLRKISDLLCRSIFKMKGKTTFKEEFVTSGGISLKEVDFKRMESKLIPKLFFCGEVLNIDGITGGFNFQNAWSTAFVAAKTICT